ncbi:MAG: DUF1080 domain-containing protein [Sandaracinaceae bacterium]|nr:DUF1080 domain-containing protein [Sandaracinaceae bacterium]
MNHAALLASSLVLLCGACNSPRAPVSTAGTVSSETPAPPSSAVAAEQPGAPTQAAPDPAAATRTRTFDDDAANAPPAGFSFGRTGSGALGRWVVQAEAGAPSGANVLAQLDTDDTDFRFPVAVLDAPVLRDVRVSVRCKMVSGSVDQACGLVARYRDENNYYITRANALEGNIRLYAVRDGQRRQLASWSGRVPPNAWHEYRLEVRGDHLEVFWNGQRVLDHHDTTFTEAGRVGVWTKADSVTHFDDLRAEAP